MQTSIFPENRASLARHQSAGYRALAVRTRIAQLDGFGATPSCSSTAARPTEHVKVRHDVGVAVIGGGQAGLTIGHDLPRADLTAGENSVIADATEGRLDPKMYMGVRVEVLARIE